MSGHTPGPWHVSSTHKGQAFDIGALDNSNVGIVYATESDVGSKQTGEANARLIAAAPDLLKAATDLLAIVTSDEIDAVCAIAAVHGMSFPKEASEHNHQTCEQARAVIAAATGAPQ